MNKRIAVVSLLCGLALAGVAFGQAAVTRTVLQRSDLPESVSEGVQGVAEFPPGTALGRHTHAGVEMGYVLSGDLVISINGKEPLKLKAGDSYTIPAGVVHDAANNSSGVSKVLATWIVEKGKPLATPAPAP